MRFRVGVNLGDVIEKPDGSIYGHGMSGSTPAGAGAGGRHLSMGLGAQLAADRFVDQGQHAVCNSRRSWRKD
jgi:hypothetical protein